jgi:hypothetical protein
MKKTKTMMEYWEDVRPKSSSRPPVLAFLHTMFSSVVELRAQKRTEEKQKEKEVTYALTRCWLCRGSPGDRGSRYMAGYASQASAQASSPRWSPRPTAQLAVEQQSYRACCSIYHSRWIWPMLMYLHAQRGVHHTYLCLRKTLPVVLSVLLLLKRDVNLDLSRWISHVRLVPFRVPSWIYIQLTCRRHPAGPAQQEETSMSQNRRGPHGEDCGDQARLWMAGCDVGESAEPTWDRSKGGEANQQHSRTVDSDAS